MIEDKQLYDLFDRQFRVWPQLRENHEAFRKIQVKKVIINGVPVVVQFNPARRASSTAKVDAQSLRLRSCFLCPDSIPLQQESLPFGNDYVILCNPYPIFPLHFTVPTREHTAQSLNTNRFKDMLELAKGLDKFTVFYNGPKSGASAPDHMHFQIAVKSYLPINWLKYYTLSPRGDLFLLRGFPVGGILFSTNSKQVAESHFVRICKVLETPPGETEPMMNVFCNYEDKKWTVTIIPRKKHRPTQYFADDEGQFLSSPGAADVGGVFITSRQEDFDKATPDLLSDIYHQVCFSDKEIDTIFQR